MPPKRKRIQASIPEDSIPSTEPDFSSSLKVSSESSSDPPGCASIMSISDKELLSVFSRLPLCDLQSLELVSPRFRWIALKVCSDRRSLSLIQKPQYRDHLEDITRYWYFTDYTTRFPFGEDCYQVTRVINSIGVEWFRERFPKLTQLTLYCVDYLSLDRFVELIQLYPTLERLVLFSTDGQQAEWNQPQFWTTLYELRESLRHLKLSFGFEQHFGGDQLAPLLTPTIRSLFIKTNMNQHEFFREDDEAILDQFGLIRQSPLRNCQYLLLLEDPPLDEHNQVNNNDDREAILTRHGLYLTEAMSPDISLGNTSFMLQNAVEYAETMTHLDLSIPSTVSLLSILPELVQLTRLTNIRLTERKTGQPPSSLFFSELNRRNYRTQLGQANLTLPSVRYLHLSSFDITPPSSMFLYLPLIFPQVHTLHLEDCQLEHLSEKLKRAFPKWLLDSVHRFGQLRKMYYNQRLVMIGRDEARDKAEKDKLVEQIKEVFFKDRF